MRREEKKRYWKLNREERDKKERQIDWTEKKNIFLRKSRERINRWQNLATTLVIRWQNLATTLVIT